MTERRKKKKWEHDSEYIAYCKLGDSAAVFIMRDIQKQVPVEGFWINVTEVKLRKPWKEPDEPHDFEYFCVELFPRKRKPHYFSGMTPKDKHYETWATAKNDIIMQRRDGYQGRKYKVYPRIEYLINEFIYQVDKIEMIK